MLAALAALAAAIVLLGLASLIRRRRRRQPPDRRHPKARPYPTAVGLWVRSYGEQRVANELARRGIRFEYEPPVLEYRPDFRIKGTRVLVEYWGGAGHENYANHMVDKIKAYEAAGWQVVSIFPIHLHELGRVLDRELAAAGITPE